MQDPLVEERGGVLTASQSVFDPGNLAATEPKRAPRLRRILFSLDAVTAGLTWTLALVAPTVLVGAGGRQLAAHAALAALGTVLVLGSIVSQHLYLARVCSVRTTEIQRLARASAIAGLGVLLAQQLLDLPVRPAGVGLTGVVLFVALVAGRTGYRTWLKERRRRGDYTRSVVLVGANESGLSIARLLADHPEAGYRLCGVVGDRNAAAATGVRWLGDVSEAESAVVATGASGAILVADAMPPHQLNRLARTMLRNGVHVHLQVGLEGVAYNRLRIVPFAYEPVLYLEQAALSRWQLVAKRGLDVLIASVALVLLSPLAGLAAAAIYLEDRGPVVFRQWRVGRDGKLFKLYKLRTMVTDAEKRLGELQSRNQRAGGPLFKLASDPRVTRVGHLLRATSIDELPQLVNVLRGEMSLVGPRPALPAEMAAFDERLRERTRVAPGITGLWQVEARDNPAFGPYQRLDLYYVDNWSVGLDLTILTSTVAVVVARAWQALVPLLRIRVPQRAPTGVLE